MVNVFGTDITNNQILIAVAVILLMWRMNMLPKVVADFLDAYVPSSVAKLIKG